MSEQRTVGEVVEFLTKSLRRMYLEAALNPSVVTDEPKVGDHVIAMHADTPGCDVGKLIAVEGEGFKKIYTVDGLCGDRHRWENTGFRKVPTR